MTTLMIGSSVTAFLRNAKMNTMEKERENLVHRMLREKEEIEAAVRTLEEEKRAELNRLKVQLDGATHERVILLSKVERMEVALTEEKKKRVELSESHADSLSTLKTVWEERETSAKLEWPSDAHETKRMLEREMHLKNDVLSKITLEGNTLRSDLENMSKSFEQTTTD